MELFTRLAGRGTGAIHLVVLKHPLADRSKRRDLRGELGLKHGNHYETVTVQGLCVRRFGVESCHALRQRLHTLQTDDALTRTERGGATQRHLQFGGRHGKRRGRYVGQAAQLVIETNGFLTGQTQSALRSRFITDLAQGGVLAQHLFVLIAERVGTALLVELFQTIGEARLLGDHGLGLGDVAGRVKAHIHQHGTLGDTVVGDTVAVELAEVFRLGCDASHTVGHAEESGLGHPPLVVPAIIGFNLTRRDQTRGGSHRLDQVLNGHLLADVLQERGLVDAGALPEVLYEGVVVEGSRVGVLEVLTQVLAHGVIAHLDAHFLHLGLKHHQLGDLTLIVGGGSTSATTAQCFIHGCRRAGLEQLITGDRPAVELSEIGATEIKRVSTATGITPDNEAGDDRGDDDGPEPVRMFANRSDHKIC